MTAFYNENDPFAAAWLRRLMKAGIIADGIVDERSIEDIKPTDLRGFTQCHFFAGIGMWSVALREAGWPDDRPVWTGSCPCQPFSIAGKKSGFSDERHLWPAWYWLISECSKAWDDPIEIFGEQVASKDGLPWLDVVQTDLEAAGYAVAAKDLCAAGIGAPHIRQRLFFVAVAERVSGSLARAAGRNALAEISGSGSVNELAIAAEHGRGGRRDGYTRGSRRKVQTSGRSPLSLLGNTELSRHDTQRIESPFPRSDESKGRIPHGTNSVSELGNPEQSRLQGHGRNERNGHQPRRLDSQAARSTAETGPVNGTWANAEWLYCRDQKFRPVESGTFPLAYAVPKETRHLLAWLRELGIDPDVSKRIITLARSNRVGRLRGYGNAIVGPLATAFIESYLETQ